jgi:hypothetical protein
MISPQIALILVGLVFLSMACDRRAAAPYEHRFTDSIRAEFELGTGYVDHQTIDGFLRQEGIGFVDGTMWSGSPSGADYTEIRVDLNTVKPDDLIRDLLNRKLIAGDPNWFLNDAEFMPTISSENTQGKRTAQTSEQDGADQPATAPELEPEGDQNPKPESEVRPQ